MPSPELIDERFDEIVRELRALPGAPESLRERVRAVGSAPEPEPRGAGWPRLRWMHAAYAVAGVVVASIGLSAVYGLVSSGGGSAGADRAAVQTVEAESGRERAPVPVAGGQPATPPPAPPPPATIIVDGDDAASQAPENALAAPAPKAGTGAAVSLPPGRRIARYTAFMKLRVEDVDELSDATKQAMRVARRFGGYVVSVRYGTPKGDEGDAFLTLRVPSAKVQEAIAQLSGLGTIVSQRISITDLQQRVNRDSDEIGRLRKYVRQLRAQLAKTTDEGRRLELELELEEARASLRRITQRREDTIREGRLAKISVTLTTREAVVTKKPDNPGRIERSAENAVDLLAKEIAAVVYLLIVLSPLVLLAAVALTGGRAYRRRYDQRLLEQA